MKESIFESVNEIPIENGEDDEQIDMDEGEDIKEDSNHEVANDVLSTTHCEKWPGAINCDPSTKLLLQFDQVMTQKVLNYHIKWIQTRFFDFLFIL